MNDEKCVMKCVIVPHAIATPRFPMCQRLVQVSVRLLLHISATCTRCCELMQCGGLWWRGKDTTA